MATRLTRVIIQRRYYRSSIQNKKMIWNAAITFPTTTTFLALFFMSTSSTSRALTTPSTTRSRISNKLTSIPFLKRHDKSLTTTTLRTIPETQQQLDYYTDENDPLLLSMEHPYGTEYHAPVMVTECIEALLQCPRQDSRPLIFIDATLGGGGHSQALLEQLQQGDVVFGSDVDSDAIQTATVRLQDYIISPSNNKDVLLPRFIPIQSNFKDLIHRIPQFLSQNYCSTNHEFKVDGILMDLGVSSHQIDESTRGFAILKDGPLDMRMNRSNKDSLTAADICNEYSELDLVNMFQLYGDESPSSAKTIAHAIVQRRPLTQTSHLLDAIASVTPNFVKKSRRKGLAATSARIFQSLRIVVNREKEALQQALTEMAPTLVRPGGHLVVLSYHSMEDRMTKRMMKDGSLSEKRYIPVERDVYGNIVNEYKKPWKMIGKGRKASDEELARNSRARSATLRVAVRLDNS